MVSRQVRAFYHSPLTPLSFALVGLFCAWGLSPWGPDAWKRAPSLQLLRHAMPFPLMALAFLVYVGLLATQKIRAVIAADLIGGVIFSSEFLALVWTARDGGISNPLVIGAVFLAVVLHGLALRLAIFEKILA